MIEDFVGVYDNFFTKDQCERAIKTFETLADAGFGFTRKENKHHKDDLSVTTSDAFTKQMQLIADENTLHDFNFNFWSKAYPDYADRYSVIKTAKSHIINVSKIQKSEVGQGYHVWHFEADQLSTSPRLLTFILYLNDVEEGAETEFLYYPKRISPVGGRLVLFPAAFTHAHRGNPVLKGNKYIITGWVDFIE